MLTLPEATRKATTAIHEAPCTAQEYAIVVDDDCDQAASACVGFVLDYGMSAGAAWSHTGVRYI
jgi:hypothetical protein